MGDQRQHPLFGANLVTLWRVRRASGPARPGRKSLLAGAFAAAGGRLPFTLAERAYVAAKRSRVEETEQPPVFILGHWRSGTTHLYNVLSKAGQFAYVPPVSTGLPLDFLLLGRMLRPFLERQLPEHRYIDRIPVTPTAPQEDELALANMSDLSFFHGIYFPQRFQEWFQRGVFLDGVSASERRDWEEKLRLLYAKLQMAQPGRRLLIKNPVYTARVAQLRALWPEAKFIHIHRNPYKVFPSMRNFYSALFDEFALQDFSHLDIDEVIFSTYERMMRRMQEDTADLPPEQFIEMAFDRFQTDPIGQIERIYRQLDLPGFEEARPAFEAYLESVAGYQKNVYTHPKETDRQVEARWGPFIEHWGYEAPA